MKLTLTFTESEAADLNRLAHLARSLEDPWPILTMADAMMIRAAGLAIKRAITEPVLSVSEAGRKGGQVTSPEKTAAARKNARQPRPSRRKKMA